MATKYKLVALGGTFDLLHKGHTTLLARAFSAGQQVTVGITTDKFCKEIEKIPYENQELRRKNLLVYLKAKKLLKRSKIVWLHDIFGPAATDKNIQALVISRETLPNANAINKKRVKNKLKKTTLIICPPALAKDKKLISSTRIREGEISKSGRSYWIFLSKIAQRPISPSARTKLKIPFGPIVKIDKSSAKKHPPEAAIGDITGSAFLKESKTPRISIVDFYVERKRIFNKLSQLGFPTENADAIVSNKPGLISTALINEIAASVKRPFKSIIVVEGEEDLATIPVVLLSPLGKYVYYGQPKKGAVRITVTEKIKEEICNLLVK